MTLHAEEQKTHKSDYIEKNIIQRRDWFKHQKICIFVNYL